MCGIWFWNNSQTFMMNRRKRRQAWANRFVRKLEELCFALPECLQLTMSWWNNDFGKKLMTCLLGIYKNYFWDISDEFLRIQERGKVERILSIACVVSHFETILKLSWWIDASEGKPGRTDLFENLRSCALHCPNVCRTKMEFRLGCSELGRRVKRAQYGWGTRIRT